MIYVDTPVLLAAMFAEDRRPPREFWAQPLLSSRLLEYETWVRIHARGLADSHCELGAALLDRAEHREPEK